MSDSMDIKVRLETGSLSAEDQAETERILIDQILEAAGLEPLD